MHPFCAAVRTHRWFADDKKIKKKNIYPIRVLFSYVLWNQHRNHHNVQSETRKLSQGSNENSDKTDSKFINFKFWKRFVIQMSFPTLNDGLDTNDKLFG